MLPTCRPAGYGTRRYPAQPALPMPKSIASKRDKLRQRSKVSWLYTPGKDFELMVGLTRLISGLARS